MQFYSGGTKFDPTTTGYCIYENYLSDLGRYVAFDGCKNSVPRILFTGGLFFAGTALIFFFLSMELLLKKYENVKKLSAAAFIFGMISSLACVSIGIVPSDFNILLHRLCTTIFGGLLVPTYLLLGIAILKVEKYSNFYGWVYITSAGFILAYTIIWYTLGLINQHYIYDIVKIVGQKIVILLIITGTVIMESFGARMHIFHTVNK